MFFQFNLVGILLVFVWAVYQNCNSVSFAYKYTPQTFKDAIDFTVYTFMAEVTISPMVYAFLLMVLVIGNACLFAKTSSSTQGRHVDAGKRQIVFGAVALAIILLFIITHGILFTMFLEFENTQNWQVEKLETLHSAYKGIVLSRLGLCVVVLVLGVLAIRKRESV